MFSLFFFFPMVFTRKGSFFVIFQSQYYFKMVKIKRYRFRSFQYRWCWEWTASLWELALFGRWCCGFQLQDSEQQITRVRREGTRRGKTAWVQIPTLHLVATYVGQVTSLLWRWTASSVKWGHCWTPFIRPLPYEGNVWLYGSYEGTYRKDLKTVTATPWQLSTLFLKDLCWW